MYADTATPGAAEDAALVDMLTTGEATMEEYGAAKAGCESLVVTGVGADHAVQAVNGGHQEYVRANRFARRGFVTLRLDV